MEGIDLSIIIPVYNTEKYLKECLDSIFKAINGRDNVEVILIDDGSTDNSHKIYSLYHNKNYRYFKNKNQGVSYSRNLGILKANGKWLMFIDSDDYLENDWYNVVSQYFETENDIVYFLEKIHKNIYTKDELLDKILKSESSMSVPTSRMFKKSLIQENNITFNTKIINGEDMLFNIETLIDCKSFYIEKIGIYNMRFYDSSSTKVFNEKIFKSDKEFHKELKRILKEKNIDKIDEYRKFCVEHAILMLNFRISLVKEKQKRILLCHVFEESVYKEYLISFQWNRDNTILNNVMLMLIKKKKYKLVQLLQKSKNRMKNILKIKQNEKLVRL